VQSTRKRAQQHQAFRPLLSTLPPPPLLLSPLSNVSGATVALKDVKGLLALLRTCVIPACLFPFAGFQLALLTLTLRNLRCTPHLGSLASLHVLDFLFPWALRNHLHSHPLPHLLISQVLFFSQTFMRMNFCCLLSFSRSCFATLH